MRLFPLIAFLLGSIAGAGAAEAPEFTGVLETTGSVRITLRDKESGVSSWLAVGGSFRGYTFKSFDAREETAVLGKDGGEIRVRLATAKVREGGAPKLTPKIAQAIFHNVHQIASAAEQYYLERGVNAVTLEQLVGPDKIIWRLTAIAGEDYSTLVLKKGVPVILTTASGEKIAAYAADAAAADYAFHVLRPGDTGAKVARLATTTLGDLTALNESVDWSRLRIGQVVRAK